MFNYQKIGVSIVLLSKNDIGRTNAQDQIKYSSIVHLVRNNNFYQNES